jgi:hypothetical protein
MPRRLRSMRERPKSLNGNKRMATHKACWLTHESRDEHDVVQTSSE